MEQAVTSINMKRLSETRRFGSAGSPTTTVHNNNMGPVDDLI